MSKKKKKEAKKKAENVLVDPLDSDQIKLEVKKQMAEEMCKFAKRLSKTKSKRHFSFLCSYVMQWLIEESEAAAKVPELQDFLMVFEEDFCEELPEDDADTMAKLVDAVNREVQMYLSTKN